MLTKKITQKNFTVNPLKPLGTYMYQHFSNCSYSFNFECFYPIFFQAPVYGPCRGVGNLICDVMSCHHASMSFLPSAVSPKMSNCDKNVTAHGNNDILT